MEWDYKSRQDALLALDGVDAIAIVPGANMQYFTGLDFHLSERPVIAIFTQEGLSVITPQLEAIKAINRPDLEARLFSWTDSDGYRGAFAEAIDALGLRGKRLGVDGMTMRVTELHAFQQIDPSLQVVTIEEALIRIRAQKRPDEMAAFREAIAISEAALAKVSAWMKPGLTERQIAERLTEELRAAGADEEAFPALVQSGPNTANPHGSVTDRVWQDGESLIIDFGGRKHHYPADITRTFIAGTPSPELQKVYETVLAANQAARDFARAGVTMGDVDRAARSVIEAAGYGEYFIHRTGHGLGLDIHEPIPQIAAGVSDLLEVGMVFTIEPGIYIPGFGGVRIEDDVVVTQDGIDVLTSFRRDWQLG